MSTFDLLAGHDRAALDLLLAEEGIDAPGRASIPARRKSPRPSFAQRRLWTLQQFQPSSPAYHLATAVRFSGALDFEVLQASLRVIVQRHEALRTTFHAGPDGPESTIHPELEPGVALLDGQSIPAAEREDRVMEFLREQSVVPFDLARGPLLRLAIGRIAENECIVALVMHHIIADAWSLDVLVRELGALYPALARGWASPLAGLPIQYADFCEWQEEQISAGVYREQAEYWKEALAGLEPLDLPTDRARSAGPRSEGAFETMLLPPALTAQLRRLARTPGGQGGSLFQVLLTVFFALLHRYSGQTDLAIGTPVANRSRAELEPLIGFFVNTVLVRADLSGSPSFAHLFSRVREALLGALANQDLPFDRLVSELLPERDLSQNPLFRVMFSVQEMGAEALMLPGIALTPVRIDIPAAKVDLTVAFEETAAGLGAAIEYRTDLFDRATITRFAAHFATLLKAVAADPGHPLAHHCLLDGEERSLVVKKWNATCKAFPQLNLGAIFRDQARRRPDAIAVTFHATELTYGELDGRSGLLAAELHRRGVGPETFVGICAERSLELIVGLLAIIRAGGAYVALDPRDPPERRTFILEDAGIRVLVCPPELRASWPGFAGEFLWLDSDPPPGTPDVETGTPVFLDHLAYLVYTSGSTGIPKGVMVDHRAVLRLVCQADYAELNETTRILQTGSLGFDAFTFELWGSLLNGGCLCLAPVEELLDPQGFGRLVSRHRVDTLFLTTGLFNALAEVDAGVFAGLKTLLTGGERCSVAHFRRVRAQHPQLALTHVYGPTENTTFTSFFNVDDAACAGGDLPIGRPIANTTIYILDENQEPAPIGLRGELYCGGDGVARGYLGRPGLTAEKFVPDVFGGRPGARLYRTGDLCRWRADGTVQFLGRTDQQVKIRGYRVELGEIEAALLAQPGVRAAVALMRPEVLSSRLIAYAATERPGAELRAGLQAQLPEYMVPSVVVSVAALPLTRNGKVDCAALPPPVLVETVAAAFVEPHTEAEKAAATVWAGVLGLERVGAGDHYFLSGGDSIGAIQVANRLRKAGWRAEARDLFQYPRLSEFARHLRREAEEESGETLAGPVPLTPAQAWFFEDVVADRHHFNQAVLLRSDEPLSEAAIAAVVDALWRRHHALRSVFDHGGHASLLPPDPAPVFSVVKLPDEPARLAHASRVHAGFDLANGPLFRVVLYRLPAGDRLLLAAHHLVVDGVSWRVLLEEMELGLSQAATGVPVELGPAPRSLRRWAEAAQARAAMELPATEEAFWAAQAPAPQPAWPEPASLVPNTFGAARAVEATLAESTTRELLTSAQAAYHTEINDLLLLALGRALRGWLGADTIHLTMEAHGRAPETSLPDLEGTVGWFTALYPLQVPISDGPIGVQLKRVKETLRSVPAKGARYGESAWLRPPAQRPAWARTAAPKLSFNYLGQFFEQAGGRLRFTSESPGPLLGAEVLRQHEIDATAAVVFGQLHLSLFFHPERYGATLLERMVADWRIEIENIVRHCLERTLPEKTPSDFTSPLFTLAEYDGFLHGRGWRASEVDDVCRLSPMQAGLLFQGLVDGDSRAYCIQVVYGLRGALHPARFAEAWREVTRRHAILRTNFIHQDVDEPFQIVWREREPELAFVDLRGFTGEEQTRRLDEARAADLARGFDYESGMLWRVAVWQLAEDRFDVAWSYHHLLLDGWSLGVVHRDLLHCYGAPEGSGPPALPAPVPFADYLRWLERRDRAASRAFWAGYLGSRTPPLGLPRLRRLPERLPPAPMERLFELDRKTSAAVRALASELGVTPAIFFQAAWGILLARYHRVETVVFGTIVSGRPAELPGVEEAVGPFICAVPVRIVATSSTNFRALAREVQAGALAAEPHHHLPLAEIQALTSASQDLFDHLLIFENYPVDRALGDGAVASCRIESVQALDRTHYDFDLTIDPGESFSFRFAYDGHLFAEDQIARTWDHLRHFLEQIVASPDIPIGDYALATPAEERLVLEGFGTRAAPAPDAGTVLDLLEAAAHRVPPDRAAVIHGDTELGYAELHAFANRLAHALQQCGAGPETPIGIFVDHSPGMIVAVLAVWKAGAAYVPLDPLYPRERLALLMGDAAVRVVVTTGPLRALLPAGEYEVVLVDEDATSQYPAHPPRVALRPEHLAYIIHTSGSTGKPKGVMIEHRSLVHAADAWRSAYRLEEIEVRLLQLARLSFDVFAGDLVRALTNGGTLVIADAETRLDPPALAALIVRHRITLFESTPGLILPLMDHLRAEGITLPDLRLLILGSDQLAEADYCRLVADFGAHLRVVNSYGITEATIDSCFYENPAGTSLTGGTAPIGRPIPHSEIYVLDDRRRPCPVGITGELFIGGPGVARGYLGRADLTAERFLSLELGGKKRRLYRSGDLARWLPDGNLEFLGRGDHQVKVRGFRVEPGEIEARLRTHPAVSEVVVISRESGGTNELVAYVVTAGDWSPAEFRAHVVAELPDYMVPSWWVPLAQLPLSPNGKVDRLALPPPNAAAHREAVVLPRTATESAIAAIWREVLEVAEVGTETSFFELGGHSLKAIQVRSRIHRELGVKLELRSFFLQPTIAGLAVLVDASERTRYDSIPMAPAAPDYPLSHAQQRLWLLHQMGGGSAYNMPEAYVFSLPLDLHALESAMNTIIVRHETLRTAFIVVAGEPRQHILAEVKFRLREIDLSADPDRDLTLHHLAEREAMAQLDLTGPPLLRLLAVRLDRGRTFLMLTMHHLVGDGWSGNILYRELLSLYDAYRRGQANPLPPLRLQYKDFADWQAGQSFAADESYWLRLLEGMPEGIALSYDFAPVAERRFRGARRQLTLSPQLFKGWRALAAREQTTVSNIALTLFKLLLFRITKQSDLCIGVGMAGRNRPELENMIGYFVNILPCRTQLSAEMTFEELLHKVSRGQAEAADHQDYPFDLLVRKLSPRRAANRQPLVNVLYAYQNFADLKLRVGPDREAAPPPSDNALLSAEPYQLGFETSKFDLTLVITEEDAGLSVTLEYDTDLFRDETIARYLAAFARFAQAVADPHDPNL